ncbi:MAG: acetylxylan esterase [Ruminococcaceae bacterium]|nr:acetylxylan esterase [Oscillospiraceae bacterium]
MDYSRLDPLISISGEKIETVSDWETFRREEIMVLLSNFIYGVRPMEKPDDIAFRVDKIQENYMGFPIVRKDITISFLGFSMEFQLFLPQATYKKKPVPAFLHVLNETSMLKYDPINTPDNPFLPIAEIAERGYGCAVMSTLNVSPDWTHRPEFKKGVFRAVQPDVTRRDNRSWATISGWAYGASRVMDYLETDSDVEHTKVAIIGHSRAGKTALWGAATDERFALSISNDSGCSGAAYTRGTTEGREHIKDINISNWFCGNYHNFDDREEMLPCDQHMLLAAIAPRPLYVKSNAEDAWAGPEEELLSCRLASPVYELYGLKGVVAEGEIEINKPYHEGTIAYHRAPGDHNLDANDWSMFMDFADKYLK